MALSTARNGEYSREAPDCQNWPRRTPLPATLGEFGIDGYECIPIAATRQPSIPNSPLSIRPMHTPAADHLRSSGSQAFPGALVGVGVAVQIGGGVSIGIGPDQVLLVSSLSITSL
jgi:hypothetical protein